MGGVLGGRWQASQEWRSCVPKHLGTFVLCVVVMTLYTKFPESGSHPEKKVKLKGC